MGASAVAVEAAPSVESVIARLERLPISRELAVARIVIGSATFFDAYTVLAIAYALYWRGSGISLLARLG
jgi:MFS transporter, putative metabolite:H+ symporter